MAYLAVLYVLQPKIINHETAGNKFCEMRCPYISFQIVPPKRDLEHSNALVHDCIAKLCQRHNGPESCVLCLNSNWCGDSEQCGQ